MVPSLRVANIHDLEPDWHWIEPIYDGPPQVSWCSLTTRRSPMVARLPGPHLGRVRASLQLRSLLSRNEIDLIVSHGPYTTYYAEMIARSGHPSVPHLAFAFNFTDLPSGYRLKAMRRAFAHVDCFAVYSRMERELYSAIFGIPLRKFVFVRWGVAPPISAPEPREMEGPYVAALGGEARDYATLCAAAGTLPHVQFVLVVRPNSLDGIDVPTNVLVHTNLPWNRAWSIMWHSEAVALPLRSEDTPNGHVTAVGSMFLAKAQVCTESIGIRDYLTHEQTALLVPAQDPVCFASAIERLVKDRALSMRLGSASRAFAREFCTEDVTVEFFRTQLRELLKGVILE